MAKNRRYIFTDREHSEKGIMSTVLGILSFGTLGTAIYLSYVDGGVSSERYGAAALLAVLFMLVGVILGIWSATEKDKFRFFGVLGIIINSAAFGVLSLILYAGAYVD